MNSTIQRFNNPDLEVKSVLQKFLGMLLRMRPPAIGQFFSFPNTINFENKPWGLYFSKAFFEGLIFGGAYLRFKIDWASPTVGSKFTSFALFYLAFESISQIQAPGGLILGGAI